MGSEEHGKRGADRIKPPFAIKFSPRIEGQVSLRWDAAIPLNISKTGIYFLSTERYEVGTLFDVKMKEHKQGKEVKYICSVVRSASHLDIKNLYETAVRIVEMDDEAKEALNQAIDFFNK